MTSDIRPSARSAPFGTTWGALFLSAGLICLLLALSKGGTWGWDASSTLLLFAGSLLALALWVLAELHVIDPLVDMRMMTNCGVWTTNLVGLAFGFAMFGIFLLIPLLVELPATGYGFGESATLAGLYLLPAGAGMVVLAPLSGVLSRRSGAKLPLAAGTVLATASFCALTAAHHRTWQLLMALALMGAGLGLAFAAMGNAIVDAVDPSQTSAATGVNTIVRYVGGSIGTAVLADVLSMSASAHGAPTSNAFTAAFAVCAAVLAMALLASFLLPRHSPPRLTQAGPGSRGGRSRGT